MNKHLGIIITMLSFIVAIIGVLALTGANEMAQNITLFAEGFNKSEWQQHWKISSLVLLISSWDRKMGHPIIPLSRQN